MLSPWWILFSHFFWSGDGMRFKSFSVMCTFLAWKQNA
jgi:hypothetical protein